MKRLSVLAALFLAASAASAAPATIGEAPTYPGDVATTTKSAGQTRHDARAQADAATPYVYLNNEGPLVDNPAYRGKAAATDRSFVRVDGPYYMN